MKRYTSLFIIVLISTGCATSPSEEFTQLPVTEAELLNSRWQDLQRFEPLYPVEEASSGNDGCASVEYVITTDYQIKDIQVIDSTSRHFARQAKNSIKKWQWSALPQGIITEPVKTKTRFEYCIETTGTHCTESRLREERQCTGEDVISAIGTKVRR